MFTIKCYTVQGRCIIRSAESFTILRDDRTGEAEISLHFSDGSGDRVDIVPASQKREEGCAPAFQWAYIVNSDGRTVETLRLSPEQLDVHVAHDGSVHASPRSAVADI